MANAVEGGKGWTRIGNEKRTGSRNWRNNNPGNIEYGKFAKSMGAIGTDGRFAVFPDYETGRRAKAGLLFNGKNYKDKTIFGAISKYAPSFENDTMAYAKSVARALGVSIHTKLSDLTSQQREVMMDAMQKVEGFKKGVTTQLSGFPEPPQARNAQLAQFPDAPLAPAMESLPALSYMPSKEALAPTPSLAYSPSQQSQNVPALGAIEAIAPSRPETANVSAPALSLAPTGPSPERFAAPPDAPDLGGGPVPEMAIDLDRAIKTGLIPGGGIMSPMGAYADPTAVQPSTLSAALTQPTSLATSMPALTAPDYTAMMPGSMTEAMPMAMQPTAVGPMPQTNVMPMATPAPPLSPPQEIKPVAQVPQLQPDNMQTAALSSMPSLSPSDIYGGAVGTAAATDGNFVSRDNFGTTSITNPMGATTAMTSGGYQSAYGGNAGAPTGFSGLGALGGRLGAFGLGGSMYNSTKGTLAGGVLGGLVGGAPGALLGGLLGRSLAKSNGFGGIFGGRAPRPSSANDRRNGPELSRSERASISPAADRSMASNGGRTTGLW